MYPIYDLDGINQIESQKEGKHVILILLVKPTDKNADNILKNLNYWHYKSGQYCSIYLMGYSQNFMKQYSDIKEVESRDGELWQYSDKCFIGVCDSLQKRLKNWCYSGEPELLILQSSGENMQNKLDFRGYYYIDINYGISKGYIDTFPRFMERLLNACRSEVEAADAVTKANRKRIKCRNAIELAIENMPKLPQPAKRVLKDKLFYKSYRT